MGQKQDQQITTLAEKVAELGMDQPQEKADYIFHFLSGLILNTAFASQAERKDAIPLFLRFVRSL